LPKYHIGNRDFRDMASQSNSLYWMVDFEDFFFFFFFLMREYIHASLQLHGCINSCMVTYTCHMKGLGCYVIMLKRFGCRYTSTVITLWTCKGF